MPHSPVTRVLGILIVAAFAGFLLWPSAEAHQWGKLALAALPVVTAIFTWTAVASAAPFDDRAFHRTLPPSDRDAFRRVIIMHLLVLAGISLAVGIYCWRVNFGWRYLTWGVLVITLPLWAWMAVMGATFSLASSRLHWKSLVYLVVFGIPLASYSVRYLMLEEKSPSQNADPETVLAASMAYAMIWWITGAKRRRTWGLALAGLAGALLPWIFAYGEVKAFNPEPFAASSKLPDADIQFTRKTIPLPPKELLPLNEVITVEGLAKNEFVWLSGFEVKLDWPAGFIVPLTPRRSPPLLVPISTSDSLHAPVALSRSPTGELRLGEGAIWESLRNRLPEHRQLIHWHPDLASESAKVHFDTLNLTLTTRPQKGAGEDSYLTRIREDILESLFERLNRPPWLSKASPTQRLVKIGELDASVGGTCRLPGGGIFSITVAPSFSVAGSSALHVHTWSPEAEDPWSGERRRPVLPSDAWIIALHPDGNAWAISGREFSPAPRVRSNVFLGEVVHGVLDVEDHEQFGRAAVLHECQLHVFWPVATGILRDPIPPPK